MYEAINERILGHDEGICAKNLGVNSACTSEQGDLLRACFYRI